MNAYALRFTNEDQTLTAWSSFDPHKDYSGSSLQRLIKFKQRL